MSDFQSADLQERMRNKSYEREGAAAPEKQRLPAHPVVELQRHLGNAHVARMIAQRAGGEEEAVQGKHDASLQRAGEEEEAIQGKHDASLQRAEDEGEEEEAIQGKHDASLQRAGDEEEAIQGKHDDPLQRESEAKIGLEGGAVDSDMSSAINSARGGGTALAEGVRNAAEHTMGSDFSNVRVHQDAQSDVLNRSMTAKAFTTGSDIFLRADQNSSDTGLMAHELRHVDQQRSGAVSGGGGGMTVGAADDAHEHDADAVAAQVTAGVSQRHAEETLGG